MTEEEYESINRDADIIILKAAILYGGQSLDGIDKVVGINETSKKIIRKIAVFGVDCYSDYATECGNEEGAKYWLEVRKRIKEILK